MIGQKFGRLLVLSHSNTKKQYRYFSCLCDCGTRLTVMGTSLRSGNTKSCGCLAKDTRRRVGMLSATHGMSKSPVYNAYKTMIARCHNQSSAGFSNYGGKGIAVCQRWRDSFENFYADMGARPAGCSIDRIDGHGNYEPSNCRWATAQEQSRNRDYARKDCCIHGHKLTMDNIYLGSRGQKNCKACAKGRAASYKRKLKAERLAA